MSWERGRGEWEKEKEIERERKIERERADEIMEELRGKERERTTKKCVRERREVLLVQ